MKTNRQIRIESLKRVMTGKWFGRIFLVMILLGFINNTANTIVATMYKRCEIQTWFDYLLVKIQSLASGMDCAVPSRAIMMQMNHSTLFMLFIAFIFGSIALFGVTAVVLKSAKEDDNGWFGGSFAGFSRPLGLAWLWFVLMVRIAFFLCLLVVPGIVASYRYSQCWNLKVENPDWSATKCLVESDLMMRGRKWQRFRLDMFFVMLSGILFTAICAAGAFMPETPITWFILEFFGGIPLIFVCIWFSVARGIFYTSLDKPTAAA